MKGYLSKAMNWLKKPENVAKVGDGLRYLAIPTGAIAGGYTFANTNGDAVAATTAMVPAAVLFTAGEALRAYNAFREGGMNKWQAAGRVASALIPGVSILFLSDGTYNPATDLGTIAGWGIAQGVTAYGDRNQERKLGQEIISQGRESAINFLRTNASDKDLEKYIGQLRRKKKM